MDEVVQKQNMSCRSPDTGVKLRAHGIVLRRFQPQYRAVTILTHLYRVITTCYYLVMLYDFFKFTQEDHHEPIWLRRPVEKGDKSYPLMILYAGYSRCSGEWRNYRAHSDIWAIECVCSGDAFLIQDGKEYTFGKGKVFILRKNTEHNYGVGPSGRLLKRFITVDGMELENLLRFLGLWGRDVVTPKEPARLEKMLKRFTDMLAKPGAEDIDLKFSCMIYEVLLTLSQSLESGTPPVIEKAIELMQNNLHRSISRQELSNELGISMTHFNRIFYEHFGVSPIRYFIDRKLAWAAHMLIRTGYSIKEISLLTGYDDPLYFSSQFKKHFGVSPKEYRSGAHSSAQGQSG
jgi:AraC-like DNA-binding protein